MGNVDSGGDEIPMFLNKYSKIRTEYDQRFGEAHVYRENSNLNNYVLFKEKWFDQSSECERFRKLQNNFNNVDHKNIAKVVEFQGTFIYFTKKQNILNNVLKFPKIVQIASGVVRDLHI